MKNKEGKTMTKEEATSLLEKVLISLAQNAVQNKRLTDYADQLEYYIYELDEKEKEKDNKKGKKNKKKDDDKAE